MVCTDRRPELQEISADLERADPEEILRWAVSTYNRRLTMSTAFGVEGCVLLSMLADIDPGIRVFNLDTGYQFPETLETRERIRLRYGIDVELIQPRQSVEEMEAWFGGPLYDRQPHECCKMRKMEPLREALSGYDAWISSIRREQTRDRSGIEVVQYDRRFDLVKISPLANWTKADVWRYVLDNDVPYNPLHDRGFTSIGCRPCTRAVAPGEDERAGRWPGFEKTECGIHSRA